MSLKAGKIAELLRDSEGDDALVIRPEPDLADLDSSGAASVDLRLGTWFTTFRKSRLHLLRILKSEGEALDEPKMVKTHYIPFGNRFILHPGQFVLGVTLEWIRVPRGLCGSIIGRSSWGRRGLIIATASGVHPGFAGCLTLELTNLGEVPIELRPGLAICQLVIDVVSGEETVDHSTLVGLRRPVLGRVVLDAVARKLASWQESDANGESEAT